MISNFVFKKNQNPSEEKLETCKTYQIFVFMTKETYKDKKTSNSIFRSTLINISFDIRLKHVGYYM